MRGEIKSPSGSSSGDHNDGQGIPQKVMGYSESKLSGSRSGDLNEGQGIPNEGSRSRDHSEGKDKPKDGYGENKLSGSRSETLMRVKAYKMKVRMEQAKPLASGEETVVRDKVRN